MSASISEFVLKVHSRCNLACDHCYVYQHADQSWQGRPRAISQAITMMAARRIAEHAAGQGLTEVSVILHGGEPLLLGVDRMRRVLSALTSQIAPVADIDLRIHSNGIQLDERWCELFDEYDVKVGVSLDGNQTANDRHRRFTDGRSSHAQVLAALALLRRPGYRHLYSGILCTIDLANDPIAVYEALVAQDPPHLDLLLPHATWEHPPHRPAGTTGPYAAWLWRVYRRWTHDGRRVPIRFFNSLQSAVRGGPSFTEAIGTDPADLLVIETDGYWEQQDSMKIAFEGAPATGMHVLTHSVDDVVRHPAIAARQRGVEALCTTCRACDVVNVCGGGLYAHRFSPVTGFDNPSAYCADLKALIGRVVAEEGIAMPGQLTVHKLPAGAFDALAAGPGDLNAINALAQMRLSMTRALVAAVASSRDGWRDPALGYAAARGWDVLCELDAKHRGTIAEIFAHPYTHIWAIRCLRPPSGADVDLDRAHMAGLGAAAAIRSGETVDLALPVRDGQVHLPTVGAFTVDPGMGAARTMHLSVRAGHPVTEDQHIWHMARQAAGQVLRVTVEDLDPFRDCQQWPVSDRLSTQEWLAWRQGLDAAGRRLARIVPAYAQVMRAGLRAVVPLRPGGPGTRSGTARQAFGGIGAAFPAEPQHLDALLLHEFQHVKLNAVLDLYPLFDPAYVRRLSVPWRTDPRPLEGVLHGTYAYLALTHLKRSEGTGARTEYLRYRSWVCDAAGALRATGALTSDGQRFVTGMARAAESESE